jgi:hypothetical protein
MDGVPMITASRHALFTSTLALLICACTEPEPTTELGDEVSFGDGTMRTFHTHDAAGTVAIGVRMTAGALQNMPTEPSDGQHDVMDGDMLVLPCCGHEIILPIPPSIREQTPIEHVVLNYNPDGHGPPGVYDHGHFDFHFYTISNDERLSIAGSTDAAQICADISTVDPSFPPVPVPMTCEQVALTTMPLPADQVPTDYISVGAVEPAMGNHLIDPNAPEFHGSTFAHTFIYGAHAGELVFVEPMVTVARLLAAGEAECFDIKLPMAFPEAGLYPTQYCIGYDAAADTYEVSVQSFASFPASGE